MSRILLYGTSLILSSIGASLQDCPGLQLIPVDPAQPGAPERVAALHPDAVLFDLAALQPVAAAALWQVQPGLLLIGVNLETGEALVFSSQPARLLTVHDLVRLLRFGQP